MKVLVACIRGNIANRDKWGHCLCDDCKSYRYQKAKEHRKITGYVKKWNDENKEKIKAYSKKWVESNPEKRRAAVLSWRSRHPENVKAMSNKAGKKWSKNNKGKRNAITTKRRAALMKRVPRWADLEKIQWFYTEAQRLTRETGVPYEVDHIFPLQGEFASGLHVHTNLQIIPRSENRAKQNKVVINHSCAYCL